VIIDGCLRSIGCRLAGVEPRFEALPEDRDPAAFIFSMNSIRGHHTRTEHLDAAQKMNAVTER
jgi:hypothetical protein